MQNNKNDNTSYPNPMDDDSRSIWVFYHLFMAIVYGGIGVLIGALVF